MEDVFGWLKKPVYTVNGFTFTVGTVALILVAAFVVMKMRK